MMQGVTRRDFLRQSALAAAAMSLGGLAACRRRGTSDAALRTLDDIPEAAIRDFVAAFRGSVIRPEDAAYAQARRVFNARFDQRPGLIARPVDVNDVATAVDYARAENLVTAVRGGGHSYAGHSTCDGGLVIDLSQMKRLEVDPARAVVRAQSGLETADLDRATHEAGLALVLAETPSVGISGLILGGGVCFLTSALGTASDNLLSARVVLADGRIVTASAEQNSDLFWALRGGGGNFGVVTDFELRAHPLTQVVAGALMFDLDQAPAVLKGYRAFLPSAPDELTTEARFVPAPDLPGNSALTIQICFVGGTTAAKQWLDALRGLGKPLADTIASTSYFDFQSSHPKPPTGLFNMMRSGYIPSLTDELIDELAAVAADGPTISRISLLHWHGEPCRVPADATAFPLRKPGIQFLVTALWQDPAQRDATVAWVEQVWNLVAPHTRGVYVNLLEDEGPERVLAAYGDNYARLATVKRKYDPSNLFRLNPNVRPAA